MTDNTTDMFRSSMRTVLDMAPASPDLPTVNVPEPIHRPVAALVSGFAAVLVVVGLGTFLLTQGGSEAQDVGTGDSPPVTDAQSADPGFVPLSAKRMPVSTALYGFSITEWMASQESATSYSEEMSSDDLTVELVASIRAAAGGVLAEEDAPPPYRATVLRAWSDSSTETPGLWAEVVVSYADGGCFLRIENGAAVVADCSTGPNPQMSSWAVTTGGASDWAAFIWWNLPDTAIDVAYSRPAGQLSSESGLTAVLDGTASLSFPSAGIEQWILLEARDAAGAVVVSREIVVPPNPDLAQSVEDSTEAFAYDADPDPYRDLLQSGDTFLAGGTAGSEPWAIVSRESAVEGKPTLGCVGVRPILSEDFCDSADGIFAQVLPIGDAGVVVFGPPTSTASVRVTFSDGRVVDVPVADTGDEYPPIAVIPVERVGQSGTAVALDAAGQALFDTTFEVTGFRVPQG